MSEQFRSKQTYPFMMVPNKIWEIGLTGNEIAVFLRVFFRANFKDECFESRGSIAEACCLSEKTVSNCFAELERLNILHITRRRIENKPNLITVNDADEWQSKRKIFPDKEQAQVNSSQGLRENLPEAQGKITYGTKLPELNSIEQDSFLNTVATAHAAATEQPANQLAVIEPEVVESSKPSTAETWKVYAYGYERRYGVPPLRNAKVNGQLKQFCERVGYAEAPAIIAFYLTQNDFWYVKQMHTIGIALSEAEKITAAYRRGSMVTKREADYIDKTSSRNSFIDQILEVRRQKAQQGGTE